METRKKKAPLMPALGWKDQVAYWLLMILTGGFGFGWMFIDSMLKDKIAFSDPRVVAYTGGTGALNCIPLIALCGIVFVILLEAYRVRKPIFGRKDVDYGLPNYLGIYPLLMKDKPKTAEVQLSRKWFKMLARIFVIAFLVCAPLLFTSIYGRNMMLSDGSIETYDAFNSPEYQYSADEIQYVRLDTTCVSVKSGKWFSRTWHAEMVVYTPGEKYRFLAHSFRGDDSEQLQMMIKMKELYGDRCIIEGVEDLHKVVEDQYSNPQARELLYELFEVDLEIPS